MEMINVSERMQYKDTAAVAGHKKPLEELTDVMDLTAPRKLDWAVEGFAVKESTNIIYGASNIGKSFLCVDLACNLTEGLKWFGREVTRGNVLYLALEGQAMFENRCIAARDHKNMSSEGFKLRFKPVDFFNDEKCVSVLIQLCDDYKINYLFIDTFARAAGGVEENANEKMQKIMNTIQNIAQEAHVTVFVVHHPGKDVSRGMRGASSVQAAADSVVKIEKNADDIICMTIEKNRDGQCGKMGNFKLKPYELTHNGFEDTVTTRVVEEVKGDESGGGEVVQPPQKLGKHAMAIWNILELMRVEPVPKQFVPNTEFLMYLRTTVFDRFKERENIKDHSSPHKAFGDGLQKLKDAKYAASYEDGKLEYLYVPNRLGKVDRYEQD